MNYEEARQIADGPLAGKWHWTNRRDGKIWPIGHCSSWKECPDCKGRSFITGVNCETCGVSGVVFKTQDEKCQGHDTAEDAARAHADWVLDNHLHWHESPDARHHCQAKEGCPIWTSKFVNVDPANYGPMYFLCPEHADRDHVAELYGAPEWSIHS